MIPQTVLALVGFLFLVAPGLVFEIRRERRRPTLEETAFREASRTALASLFFTVVAVSILAAIRARWPWLMPDAGRWLRDPKTYVPDHYRLVAGFFLAELVLACALALGFEKVLGRKQQATIRLVPVWYVVFRRELPTDKKKSFQPFARVRLTDDTEYSGFVASAVYDDDVAKRELALEPPMFRRIPGGLKAHPLSGDWKRIVIRGTEIRDLWVMYREVDRPPRRRLRWLRWRR